MELKRYQNAVMSDLSSFMDAVDQENDIVKGWNSYWSGKDIGVGSGGVPFYQNKIRGVPHVCMKVHMKVGFIQNSFILERVDPSTMPQE